MIVILHHKQKVQKVISLEDNSLVPFQAKHVVNLLKELANEHPEQTIGWCEDYFSNQLSFNVWKEIFSHDLIMASYSVSRKFALHPGIGYVENSPFLKINFENTYPTWLMSTDVGGISAQVLKNIDEKFFDLEDLSFFLNCIAKLGQNNNMFCYSEPRLLLSLKGINPVVPKADINYLFRFVRQNFRLQWLFILLFNYLVYEKKFYIKFFLSSLKEKSNRKKVFKLDSILISASIKAEAFKSLDVIIPTLGRKEFLRNFLSDLKEQTFIPTQVIIIEQNPGPESGSELDYLNEEDWPFKIIHHFTHKTGAANARNWALNRVESEWVFFADDDIRIAKNFLESAFKKIHQYKSKCNTFSCVPISGKGLKNERINQSTVFGAGNSIVKLEALKGIKFSKKLELGYGEDMEFGMQIRNNGIDVIHFPNPQIIHLKAPSGGFRSSLKINTYDEETKPKPAPTVMWTRLYLYTKEQFYGYKTFFFISQIRSGNFNLRKIAKRWNSSLELAKKL